MKRLETQLWRSLLGALFTLQPPREHWSVTLRLDSVRDLGTRGAPGAPVPCYSLLFSQQAPERGHAPQGLYRLSHPELGAQELFVVPLGPAPGARMTYEIILN
jgi:hypothetical protein